MGIENDMDMIKRYVQKGLIEGLTIYKSDLRGWNVFISTLAYLLADRKPKRKIVFGLASEIIEGPDKERFSPDRNYLIVSQWGIEANKNMFGVRGLENSEEDNFLWEYFRKMDRKLKKTSAILNYGNTHTILCDDLYYLDGCLLASVIPSYKSLAFVFEDEPLTEIEIQVLKQLSVGNSTLFVDEIRKMLENHPEWERKDLENFIYEKWTQPKEATLGKYISDIKDYKNKIDADLYRIEVIKEKIEEAKQNLELLHQKYNALYVKPEDRNEHLKAILEFLEENKNVISLCVEDLDGDEGATVEVKGFLDDYDYDRIEEGIMNLSRSSVFYHRFGEPTVELQKFYIALFLSGRYKIRTNTEWNIQIGKESSYVRITENWEVNTIPNPHLYVYQCFGAYKTDIYDALKAKDFVKALTTMILSSKSINVNEYASFHYVIDWLWDKGDSCIYDTKTGEILTAQDLLKHISEGDELYV